MKRILVAWLPLAALTGCLDFPLHGTQEPSSDGSSDGFSDGFAQENGRPEQVLDAAALPDLSELMDGMDASQAPDMATVPDMAQPIGWTKQMPAQSPSPRHSFGMAFDRTRNVTVLFGGYIQVQPQPNVAYRMSLETWEWDGADWMQRMPKIFPSARAHLAMAFFPEKNKTFIYGGQNDKGQYFNETWSWDGIAWTQELPLASPPARADAAMSYDPVGKRLVVFGGSSDSGYLNDAWSWDGTSWSPIASMQSPPARADAAFASDGKRLLLFGGDNGARLNDTWQLDAQAWTQLAPAMSPPGAVGSMAFDPPRTVLYCLESGPNPVGATWEFDGNTWARQNRKPSPPSVIYQTVVYDRTRGQIVFFGGHDGTVADGISSYNETWTYREAP